MAEAGAARRVRKTKYVERLIKYLDTYKNILIVQVSTGHTHRSLLSLAPCVA